MAHTIVNPGFERTDGRGRMIEILNRGPWHTVLSGEMKTGAVMGNHYHKKTLVFFFVPRGRVVIDTVHAETGARDRVTLASGEGVLLTPMESHAIRFQEPSEFLMLKSVPYDPKDPDTFELEVPD